MMKIERRHLVEIRFDSVYAKTIRYDFLQNVSIIILIMIRHNSTGFVVLDLLN